jgi:hypothetical protein
MSIATSNNTSNVQPFKYKQLNLKENEIRVIRILPRQTVRQPICCELKHTSLTNERGHGWTPFTTLSYTWGPPSLNQRTVLISGQKLLVRQNLHDFLDRASKASSRIDEWLWIDQICINQDNSRERNHQVAQMARIYQSSARTLVWLGTGFDGSSRLMAAFNATDTLRIGPQIAAACRQLAQLSYWTRLWICQEVVLSRELFILIGNALIAWDIFADFWVENSTAIEAHIQASSGNWQGLRILTELIESRRGREKAVNWLDLMQLTAHRKCKEPFDRVYGLNGMVSAGFAVDVDYARSAEDLFVLTAVTAAKDLPLVDWYSWFVCAASKAEWLCSFTEAPVVPNIREHLQALEVHWKLRKFMLQLWQAIDRRHITRPLPLWYDVSRPEGLLCLGKARQRLKGVVWEGWKKPSEVEDCDARYGPAYVDSEGFHWSLEKDRLLLKPDVRERFGLPYRPYTDADRRMEQERYSRN